MTEVNNWMKEKNKKQNLPYCYLCVRMTTATTKSPPSLTFRHRFTVKEFAKQTTLWVTFWWRLLGSLPIRLCSRPGTDLYHGSRAKNNRPMVPSPDITQSPTEATLSILSNLTLLSLPHDHRPVLISVCVRMCLCVCTCACVCVCVLSKPALQ